MRSKVGHRRGHPQRDVQVLRIHRIGDRPADLGAVHVGLLDPVVDGERVVVAGPLPEPQRGGHDVLDVRQALDVRRLAGLEELLPIDLSDEGVHVGEVVGPEGDGRSDDECTPVIPLQRPRFEHLFTGQFRAAVVALGLGMRLLRQRRRRRAVDRNGGIEAHPADPEFVHRLAQHGRSVLVDREEGRLVDPEIVMGGREMKHRIAAGDRLPDGLDVPDVAVHESIVRKVRSGLDQIEDHHFVATLAVLVAEPGTDESRAAGDADLHVRTSRPRPDGQWT